jgi:flagellar biosynthesis protein FlhA
MPAQKTDIVGTPFFRKNSDVFMAVALIGILALMIIPIPPFLLDIFLACNMTIALVMLLVGLYTEKPLDFSVFPSLLLVTTLFRLSLNIASTRLILLHGNEGPDAAGAVIMSFGQFVVGGNYVVGGVIFLILVIINFVVITKGAGRVAEVSARFTLDAMPGKQMAIDSDLAAGMINDNEARTRRSRISREADFYGSMDGASKFVRGDAVAGLLIMLVNLFGGFIIGVWQKGMPFESALTNYSLLTVGEGLMAQIPALIISTAAGIIVTRTADEKNLGHEITDQFLNYPKAFYVSSGFLLTLGIIPGLPHLAFFVLSGAMYFAGRMAKEKDKSCEEIREPAGRKGDAGVEQIGSIRPLDILELEVGYGLVPLVDALKEGELLERIRSIRHQFAMKMGFVVPPVHIHDNLQLKPYEYNILIKGARVGGGELSGQLMAMDAGVRTGEMEGTRTTEPVFGLPAVWIKTGDREQAQLYGYTVVDNSTIIATHISEIIKKHAPELLGRQELQELLDNLSSSCPKVVEELVPSLLPLGTVLRVIKNLLMENVSIRDFRTILETLADYAALTKDPETLTEFVRQALGRNIIEQYKHDDDTLYLLSMDRNVEEIISDGVQNSGQDSYLAIEPGTAQRIIAEIRNGVEKFNQTGSSPVLIASPSIRRHVKKLTERFMPSLAVISHNEIPPNVKIQSLGVINQHAS